MALEKRKPIEPIVVLIGAIIAFIIGLNLNFVSLRFLGFTILGYTGLEIIESFVLFGISTLITVFALLLYKFGENRKAIVLSRNLTIIGIFPEIGRASCRERV